jgi:radical SAM enzyme (TIGR01210 family)
MISVTTEKPLACWPGTDNYSGAEVKCLTVIFKTSGCRWNKCLMCGYRFERYHDICDEDLGKRLIAQVNWVKENFDLSGFDMIKIFTSGSFFDPEEVPPEVLEYAGGVFRGKIVIAETRAEYVQRDSVKGFLDAVNDGTHEMPLYIAMGLETTDDFIREKCIDKGLTFDEYKGAAGEVRAAGAGVKTYLMMKPLFLTEKEAIDDMKKSLRECSEYSDIISMNLCTIQGRTEVEHYWKRREYRPPYLWSVLDVLIDAERHILCDPVGGGKMRGPHNCGECDHDIVDGIRTYSLNYDRELLRSLFERGCRCKEEWEFVLDEEKPYCMPLTR